MSKISANEAALHDRCRNAKRYDDKPAAEQAAITKESKQPGVLYKVVLCSNCAGYHLIKRK